MKCEHKFVHTTDGDVACFGCGKYIEEALSDVLKQNKVMRKALEEIAYGTLSLGSEAWMLATETLTECDKV